MLTRANAPQFPVGFHVRIQQPLVFAPRSKPEPDVAVVTGSFRDYAQALDDADFDLLTTAGHVLGVPAERYSDRSCR